MLATSTQALWYLTRGTGLVSLGLLTLSVVLGITEAQRWSHPRWPRFVTAGLHRNISLLVTVFLAVHIVTAVADTYAPIHWLNVVVPGTARYRPIWLGLGAVASDLLAALIVTSLLRKHLGRRAWRAVHWTAYAAWPVALVHGLGTGSDTHRLWAIAIELGSLAAVAAALWWRLATLPRDDVNRRVLGTLGGLITVVAIVGFALLGPMRPGWARRAGTPTTLLASARVRAAAAASSPPVTEGVVVSPTTTPPTMALPFTAALTGSLSQSSSDTSGNSTVDIIGTLSTGATGRLHIVLTGPALSGGGIQMTASGVTLGPLSQPSLYRGRIVSLEGTRLVMLLNNASGQTIEVAASLDISENSSAITGRVSAQPYQGEGDG